MKTYKTDLLINAICAYLPYGICVKYQDSIDIDVQTINPLEEEITGALIAWYDSWDINQCKLYLRPMCSMTEEESIEFINLTDTVTTYGNKGHTCILSLNQIKWLNSHRFDYMGLEELGLSLPPKKDTYKD